MAAAAKAVPDREAELAADAAALLDAIEANPRPARRRLPRGGRGAALPVQPAHAPVRGVVGLGGGHGAIPAGTAWRTPWPAFAAAISWTQRTGALREFFDADWNAAAGPDGRIVEPGHQLEWAWLMQRWSLARGDADGRAAAERLFEIGSVQGVDTTRNVAFNALDDTLTPLDLSARLWPQTERIKAALIMARTGSSEWMRSKAAKQAADGVRGLQQYLDVATPGLWRDKLQTNGGLHRGTGSGQLLLPHHLRLRPTCSPPRGWPRRPVSPGPVLSVGQIFSSPAQRGRWPRSGRRGRPA